MFELDPAVRRETLRIALGTLILSAVMEAVFLLLGKWDPTVLLGNLLGAFTAVLNFFLMSVTVTKCIGLTEDKAALRIRTSQMGRLFMQGAFAAVGALLPCFNTVAVLIPLLFPSIVIVFIRLLEGKKKPLPGAADGGTEPETERIQEETQSEETQSEETQE